jgi:hypothetical protein
VGVGRERAWEGCLPACSCGMMKTTREARAFTQPGRARRKVALLAPRSGCLRTHPSAFSSRTSVQEFVARYCQSDGLLLILLYYDTDVVDLAGVVIPQSPARRHRRGLGGFRCLRTHRISKSPEEREDTTYQGRDSRCVARSCCGKGEIYSLIAISMKIRRLMSNTVDRIRSRS